MSPKNKMTLNLYPDSDVLAEAFSDVLVDFDWKSYTIVYEKKENLIRVKDILQIHQPNQDFQTDSIHVEQLTDNYAIFLKKIRQTGSNNIILDISAENIVPFLQAASTVNMLTEYTNYFITNLDTHTLDFSGIPEIGSNITCLRIVDPYSNELTNALRVWRQRNAGFEMTEKQGS
jgi:glutamate receptor, ionotropic, invertebrate